MQGDTIDVRVHDSDGRRGHIHSEHSIEVHVQHGDSHRSWHLNKYLLCNESAYFRNACDKGHLRHAAPPILLEDTDPAIFDSFVRFLSKGDYELTVSGVSGDAIGAQTSPSLDPIHHTKAWILGWQLQSASFMDCAVRKVAAPCGFRALPVQIERGGIAYAFEGTESAPGQRQRLITAISYALRRMAKLESGYGHGLDRAILRSPGAGVQKPVEEVLVGLDLDEEPEVYVHKYWVRRPYTGFDY